MKNLRDFLSPKRRDRGKQVTQLGPLPRNETTLTTGKESIADMDWAMADLDSLLSTGRPAICVSKKKFSMRNIRRASLGSSISRQEESLESRNTSTSTNRGNCKSRILSIPRRASNGCTTSPSEKQPTKRMPWGRFKRRRNSVI